jgi:hypothetical protein
MKRCNVAKAYDAGRRIVAYFNMRDGAASDFVFVFTRRLSLQASRISYLQSYASLPRTAEGASGVSGRVAGLLYQ